LNYPAITLTYELIYLYFKTYNINSHKICIFAKHNPNTFELKVVGSDDYMWSFVFGAVVINLIIIYFMPKKITHKEIYITWFLITAITLFVDLIIGASLDLFDYGMDKKPRVPETIIEATLTPSAGIIFINFMPKKMGMFCIYVLAWTIFSVTFEWLSVKVGFLTYKGWDLKYSIPFYPVMSFFLRWHLYYLRKF
jgi:hypothetical protein